MKGRPPVPTTLKVLRGNPGKRPLNENEPQFLALSIEIPPELEDDSMKLAREEWERVVPELVNAGVAKRVDRTALLAYCVAFQRWWESQSIVRQAGVIVKTRRGEWARNPYLKVGDDALLIMKSFMSDFGFTPAARVRLKVVHPEEAGDEMDDFLSRRA